MTLRIKNAPVIAAGDTISTSIDVTAGAITTLGMPDEWDKTRVTFQISADGETYRDLFDAEGVEVSLFVQSGTVVMMGGKVPAGWLRIRSGTRDRPKPQSAQRTFLTVISVEAPDEPPPIAARAEPRTGGASGGTTQLDPSTPHGASLFTPQARPAEVPTPPKVQAEPPKAMPKQARARKRRS